MTKKITDILSKMTIEEKVLLLNLESSTHSKAFEQYGIPSIRLTDGVTGVSAMQIMIDFSTSKTVKINHTKMDTRQNEDPMKLINQIFLGTFDDQNLDHDSFLYHLSQRVKNSRHQGEDWTIFPSGINIGSTWDEGIAYQVGYMIGAEHKACGVDVVLGPNLDIQRDPLGGRNYEMYGEDPYLVGTIGSSLINGLQSTGLGASAKHVAANNIEKARTTVDVIVSKRALFEIYLKGFEMAIKKANVKTIMSAYNAINGSFCSYNQWLLTDVLKNRFGFKGAIVSDWGAVQDNKNLSIKAGMDLILSGQNDMHEVLEAVKRGELSENEINDRASRVLDLTFDVIEKKNEIYTSYNSSDIRKSLIDVLVEGMILLKNNHEVLPIPRDKKTIFWNEHSKKMIECGTGSTKVYSNHTTSLYQSAAMISSDDLVYFEEWKPADYFVYTVGLGSGEGIDREHMNISPEDQEKLPLLLKKAKSHGLKTVIILNIPGPINMGTWWEDADAILTVYIPGSEGGLATANALYGLKTPGGKLTTTYPRNYFDTPTWMNFPGEGNQAIYGEGIFVGYRYYDTVNKEVLYPFGYGLSYTLFDYRVVQSEILFNTKKENSVSVDIEINNVGKYHGSEVIQGYIKKIQSKFSRPTKELKSYKKVWLNPGESKTITLSLNKDDLVVYDSATDQNVLEIGEYEWLIGTSSRDIKYVVHLIIAGDSPFKLGAHTIFKDIVENEQAFNVLKTEIPTFASMSKMQMNLFMSSPLQNVLDGLVIMTVPDAVKAKIIVLDTIKKIEELN